MKNTFSILILVLATSISLHSCLIADDIFYENNGVSMGNLQTKIESNIQNSLKENDSIADYLPYEFTDVKIHKPLEMALVDSLTELKGKNRTDEVTHQIDSLETLIAENEIEYILETDHYYQFSIPNTDSTYIRESKFMLNQKLELIYELPLLQIETNSEKSEIFYDYFYEEAIFRLGDYQTNYMASIQFYRFFKAQINQINSPYLKSKFLDHTLYLCQKIKDQGEFDQNRVLKEITYQTISENPELPNYQSIEFSDLYEINESEEVVGYYFFHKFSTSTQSQTDTLVYYVGFNPYYQVVDLRAMQEPYNNYFNE